MSSRFQASDRTPANGATVSKDLPDHKTKNLQLIIKSGLALVVILFAFTTMPSTSHAAVPNLRVESNSDTEPAARSKAENNARYKRLRAKAHRNAARAKAHARAIRAAEESR